MLYLVKGRAGSGKTEYLNSVVKSVLEQTSSKPLLIVPEQFSFESERNLLRFLGEKNYNKIQIYSFSRLAFTILKDSFDFSLIPSVGVRLALMHEAICTLEGRINIFKNIRATVSSISPLLDFSNELKYCGIKSDDLASMSEQVSDAFLKDKINEINIINDTYDALVKQSYFDDSEAVSEMNKHVLDKEYFKNKTVFIDGFRAFSKQEADAFEIMLSQADNVYVSLCTDDNNLKRDSSFCFIKLFEKRLRTIAYKNNTVVNDVLCTQKESAFSKDIFAIEKALFDDSADIKSKTDGSVKIVECADSYDECEFISGEIKRLLRSGEYRCRDIAVIERTAGVYKNRIIERLRKLDIPVFDDSRRLLKHEPLFVFIDSVLKCITSGFTVENVFGYLKSGLADISLHEVSSLEKYALVWNISGNQWSDDFTMHPDGFGCEMRDSDLKKIDDLNRIRKRVVVPLLILKKECKDKTGDEISRVIYNFIIESKISDKLFDLYNNLNNEGFSVEAGRQSTSWDLLMVLLSSMAKLYNGRAVPLSVWVDKFLLLVDSGDVGEIPQGLDEVKIGSADRIRTEKIKIVFLVGLNKEQFPLVALKSGVLTDSDRVSLTSLGLEIKPPFEDTFDEERFISYCAVTAASEKLYLTYKLLEDDGSPAFKSEIVDTALKCIEDVQVIETKNMPLLDKIESDEDAFSLLAKNFSTNNSLNSTLREYFKDDLIYSDRLTALNRAVGKVPFVFNDTEISKNLFGKNLYLSASRVETYFNCPFSYYMRYGLKAEPLRVAELDSMQGGTIIHHVMENVLKKYPKATFVDVDEAELRKYIDELLMAYLEDKMGSVSNKSKRFLYLFNRFVDICITIIDRLKQEFRAGSFEPHDFELKIGGDQIPPYEVELEDGKVILTGAVDRVDIMEKDGIKYLRVIDYKTGKKTFRLSELFSGINIQMVLYLMALEANGKEYYGEFLPAGVLYLPSKIGMNSYMSSRNPSEDDITATKRAGGKLSGMVLNSPVVYNGMGVDVYPDYFPVGYNKNGDLTGDNYTIPQFRALSSVVNGRIRCMGDSLQRGIVSATPCGKDGKPDPCGYCAYRMICSHEYGDEINEIYSVKHSEALNRLEVEEIGE